MWCVPNLFVLVLGLFVLAVLVGLARWAITQLSLNLDPFLINLAYVILVVVVVLWVLAQFCLFGNLTAIGPHR